MIAIGMALALGPVPQAAPLAHRGPWTINYAERLCVASRNFGSVEDGIELALIGADTRGSKVELMARFASDDDSGVQDWEDRLQVDGRDVEIRVASEAAADFKGRTVRIALGVDDSAMIAAGKQIELPLERKRRVRIATTNIATAYRELNKCQRNLMGSLGVDLQLLDTATTPAKVRRYAHYQADGVTKILKPGERVSMHFLLAVEPDGRVSKCQLVNAQGRVDFSASICPQIERGMRYHPARDANGEAVRSWEIYPMKLTVGEPVRL